MSVTLQGLSVVIGNIDKIATQMKQAESNGINETAIAIQSDARRRTPVDTGRLRASINLSRKADRFSPVAIVEANTNYASSVEFGTFKSSAQPYMVPAMELNKKNLSKNIAKHMRAIR